MKIEKILFCFFILLATSWNNDDTVSEPGLLNKYALNILGDPEWKLLFKYNNNSVSEIEIRDIAGTRDWRYIFY